MSTAGGDFSIRHNGEGLTGEELDYLLTNIIMSESYNPELGRYTGIARGVFSALEIGDVSEVIVETAKNGDGARYVISNDNESRKETSLRNGLKVNVKRGRWYSKPLRALALQGILSDERKKLKNLTVFAEFPIIANGKNIAKN